MSAERWPVWGVYVRDDGNGHDGHKTHNHASHAGLTICSCGEPAGSYSFMPPDELPSPCPACETRRSA